MRERGGGRVGRGSGRNREAECETRKGKVVCWSQGTSVLVYHRDGSAQKVLPH